MTAAELLATYPVKLPTSPGRVPKILKIRVKVLDTREIFSGRVDVKITPVAGEGEVWVAETSLVFDMPPNEGHAPAEYEPHMSESFRHRHNKPRKSRAR